MSLFPLRHPSIDRLADFTDATGSGDQQQVAAHLATCSECRAVVTRLRSATLALREGDPTPLPQGLRDRVLAKRASGGRVLLPMTDLSSGAPRRGTSRWLPAAIAAAAILMILGETIWSSGQEADASSTTGVLTIAPAMPRPGQPVVVTYQAPGPLSAHEALVLRARLRTANGEAYETGVPVRVIATLIRGKDRQYTAHFVLPDSIVFAALVVEDPAGVSIDDYNQHTWEVLTSADGTTPSLAALNQRTQDMMGRSFQEGHATARRMIALYPDSVSGWNWLKSFEIWMGLGTVDSLSARHRSTLSRFDHLWGGTQTVPAATVGAMAWYARMVDTASHRTWKERLMRDAPTNGFALLWRLNEALTRLAATQDTAAAWRTMETLWVERSADRTLDIAGAGLSVAVGTRDQALIDTWASRLLDATSGSLATATSIAEDLARVPALAEGGMTRLRLVLTTSPAPEQRRLTETTADFAARTAMVQRRALAALGRALVAQGATRAGLDTLMLAASAGWDLPVIRTLRTASFTAGDSAMGWAMTARLLADPTTTPATKDSLAALARRTLGGSRWSALEQDGVQTFAQRVMAGSQDLVLVGSPRLRDVQGRGIGLPAVGEGRVTVIAFWSRFCGWALNDIQNLNNAARRLEQSGARLVIIIEDEPAATPALMEVLAELQVTAPVYFDVEHTTSKAFNNWGTPGYYVIDQGGRPRFAVVREAREAMVRAEALRLSARP